MSSSWSEFCHCPLLIYAWGVLLLQTLRRRQSDSSSSTAACSIEPCHCSTQSALAAKSAAESGPLTVPSAGPSPRWSPSSCKYSVLFQHLSVEYVILALHPLVRHVVVAAVAAVVVVVVAG